MSEKMNHSDLSAMLAKDVGLSLTKADAFTKALFDIIIEGLEQEGIVKINGLGTFKITDVADRYSVNVNTGEKFEIKGHKKLTFIPAESLKESVNRPFAMFEPVEVDESYSDDEVSVDNDTEESISVINEDTTETPVAENFDIREVEEEMPCENGDDTPEVTAAPQIEEEQCREESENIAQSPVNDNPVKEELPAEEQKETEETLQNTETEAVVAAEPDTTEEVDDTEETTAQEDATVEPEKEEPVAGTQPEAETEKPAAPVKKKSGLRFFLFFILGAAVGFIAINRMSREHNDEVVDCNAGIVTDTIQATPAVIVEEPVITIEEPTDTLLFIKEEKQDESGSAQEVNEVPDVYTFILVDELAARSDKDIADADTTLYTMTGEIAVHVVAEDERLAKISNTYYGSRKLWPYIAKYNRLKKPYGITVGMKLAIPELRPIE